MTREILSSNNGDCFWEKNKIKNKISNIAKMSLEQNSYVAWALFY